jgi:hypothetical protein
MLSYESSNKGLPPMAIRHTGQGWWDDHGWYSLIGGFLGYDAWAARIDLSESFSAATNADARRGGETIKIHECPADIGLQRNEWPSAAWARTLGNYVANAGNTNYGQQNIGTDLFLGAPLTFVQVTNMGRITDGTSKTLMMSECWVLPSPTPGNDWGGTYSDNQTSLGGQVFTGWDAPNSTNPDLIGYGRNGNLGPVRAEARFRAAGMIPFPTAGPNTPDVTRLHARSKHRGGVNASRCDGSTQFYGDQINDRVWNALTSARGADREPELPSNL